MSGYGPHLRCALVLLIATAMAAGAEIDVSRLPPPAERKVDFRRDIYPILSSRCFECHRGDDPSSGQRLDDRERLLSGGLAGPVVVLHKSAASPLIHVVCRLVEGKEMPQEGKPLSAEQIGLLRAWIDQGLAWDYELLPKPGAASAANHWAFQRVERPEVPLAGDAAWVRNPIDRFIAAGQAKAGTRPAPEAGRRTLVRRLSLDLLGLPPTVDEVTAFVSDESPDAYEKLVERLLASPHYGERYARHWLDVARWAETEGYESNHPRPFAWRYRDWVVDSFNRDEPLADFIRKQIAGDELTPYRDENLIATGFLAAARLSSNEEDKPRQRNDVLVDIVNATGSAFLGLTLHCAQCHDHKFDPISQQDYYRLQGYFVRGQPANLALKGQELWDVYNAAKAPEYDSAARLQQVLYDEARGRLIADAKKALSSDMQAVLDLPPERRTAEQEKLAREADLKLQFSSNQIEKAIRDEDRSLYEELKKKLAALEKRMPPAPQTWGYYAVGNPTAVDVLPMKGFYPLEFERSLLTGAKSHVLVRGEVHQRGEPLEPSWPTVFDASGAGSHAAPAASRLALADWLTDRRNPLTARVWVNRLWQFHFGRGPVATAGDFGVKGSPPTHPELLDWLAAELMDHHWSTKHIHRLIVGSSTYRQAARPDADNARLDPENRTYWRWQPRRIEAEVVRDALLAVSGELERTPGGPSVPLEDEAKNTRRALYQFQKRDNPPPVQAIFDGPSTATESCARRYVTTTALQPLYLLNNDFVLQRARALARRVESAAPSDADVRQRVVAAFELVLGRPPDDEEYRTAEEYLRTEAGASAANESAPSRLAQFCHALVNLNEFVYVE